MNRQKQLGDIGPVPNNLTAISISFAGHLISPSLSPSFLPASGHANTRLGSSSRLRAAASLPTIAGHYGLPKDVVYEGDVERKRDVKGWLRTQMPQGRKYTPTYSKPAIDLERLQKF